MFCCGRCGRHPSVLSFECIICEELSLAYHLTSESSPLFSSSNTLKDMMSWLSEEQREHVGGELYFREDALLPARSPVAADTPK